MEHDGCVGCKYENESEDSKHCSRCTQNAIDRYTPMTNADKIRSMSDEELAEFMCKISSCHPKTCPAYNTCMSKSLFGMKHWLQSEVKGSE